MSAETDNNNLRGGRKQQKRSIVTQQKLLDAAVEAFSENGFNGTSTRDIADRAGVHHPLITYHFKNKDALWRAAANREFLSFRNSLSPAFQESANDCPKARMSSLIRSYVRYAKQQPAMHKVLVQEAHFPNERLDWLIETHLKPLFEPVFELIEELQRLGVAPKGNAKLLFNMIRLSSGGLLALGNELKASSDIDVESQDTLDEIADMIVAVFLPGDMPSTA
ncbi:MAG: TetR/AcrR family transcriptional regulator [Woeseiaceae bacterium]